MPLTYISRDRRARARTKADEDPGSRRQYAFLSSPAWAQGLFARDLFSAIEDVRSTLSFMKKNPKLDPAGATSANHH